MAAKSTPVSHYQDKLAAPQERGDKLKAHHEALASLHAKLTSTRKRAREAQVRIQELEAERADLSVAAFEDDETAKAKLDAVESEISRRHKEVRLAREATHRYADESASEEEQLAEAQKQQARAKIEALAHQRYEAGRAAEETMNSLLEHLRRIQDLHQQQSRIAASDLGDQRMLLSPPDRTIAAWLSNRLQQYLGLSTSAQFRQPLPELDSYSSKGDS